MSGHTPGPWHVDDDGTILAENGNEVFASHSDGSWHYIAATQEDRRLIAAAPDLLAALEWSTALIEREWHLAVRGSYGSDTMEKVLAKNRAAIAKAKKDT